MIFYTRCYPTGATDTDSLRQNKLGCMVPVIDQTDTVFLNHTDIYLTHLTYQMTDLHLYWFCVDTELITDIIKFMKQSKESVYQ